MVSMLCCSGDDLEEANANLQRQIKEFDSRLKELYKIDHELSMTLDDPGFPGYTRNDVEMIDKAMRVGHVRFLALIPKNTLLLVEEYVDGSYKTTYNGLSGYIKPITTPNATISPQ